METTKFKNFTILILLLTSFSCSYNTGDHLSKIDFIVLKSMVREICKNIKKSYVPLVYIKNDTLTELVSSQLKKGGISVSKYDGSVKNDKLNFLEVNTITQDQDTILMSVKTNNFVVSQLFSTLTGEAVSKQSLLMKPMKNEIDYNE